MGRVWSDANKYARWLDVELAATETLAEAGQVPKDAAAAIRAKAKVDAARVNEIEARVKHDVIAFTMAVGESIGDAETARWLHYGMTSNDVVDTAQSLLVRDASRLIEAALVNFRMCWEAGAGISTYAADWPDAWRAAEPITFGLKMANWYAENQRNIERFEGCVGADARGENFGCGGKCVTSGAGIEERFANGWDWTWRRWLRR